MKVTEILSKPIINLYTGEFEGTIKNICFDKNTKTAKWLIFFDDSSEIEEKALQISQIYKMGTNAVVIKNSDAIYPMVSAEGDIFYNSPMNNLVYNTEGENIGKVREVNLTSKFVIESVETENQTIPYEKAVSKGKDTLVINETNKKINIKGAKQRKIFTKSVKDITVSTQPIELPPKIQAPEPLTVSYSKDPLPIRILTNNNYLIGRKVLKNICGMNNEIIAKKDTIVTLKNVEWAKQNNKIIELALYSVVTKA